MAAEWYLKIADNEASPPVWSTVGPLSAQELRAMAGKGRIGPDDLVRHGNEGSWVPATRVKGLLAATTSTGQAAAEAPSEAIPVARLLKPADGKSSKAKTPSKAAPLRKKRPEPGKTAKAIEEPATELNLPPVVAKGSVPPPAPPSSPMPVPPVANVPAANEAAASPSAASEPEAQPAMVPPGRHSPGIELPFDVSPSASSGAHARVAAADKAPAPGPGKAPAAKEKPKFQINYTWVAVGAVVVISAGLFIFVSMSGNDSKDKGKKAAASASSEKPLEEAPKDTKTSPEVPKKPEESNKDTKDTTDDLTSFLIGPKGKPVGPAKPVTPPAKTPDNKKPEKTDNGAQDKWVDASKDPAVTKNFNIAVTSARYTRVKKDDAVAVVLKITNNVKNRRLKCQWDALRQVRPDSLMVDNFDATAYRLLLVRPDPKPMDPEESREATLYFEKPIHNAKYVHLKLPGAIFDETDPVKLEIPLEMIKAADENGDEDVGPATHGPSDPNKLPRAPSDPKVPPKGIPGVDAPADPDTPLPLDLDPKTRWQPRGNGGVELADGQRGRPAAVFEQRINDFDDDPATVERFGQPSTSRDPDRAESRHVRR